MSSFGERLRAGREEKDISLAEVSKATKISLSVLQALENDQFDDLPPNVYVRGFIRSYCRYGGLDETEFLKSYEEAAAAKKTAEFDARKAGAAKGDRARLFILLVLLAVLLALFLHDSLFTRPNVVKVVPEPRKDLSALKAETPAAKEEAAPEDPIPPPAPTIPLRMVISCVSGSWLELTIDQDRPFEVNLMEGDEVCWKGEERIVLKVGNAGGVSISVNEIPLKPFGKPEEVVNLLFEGNAVSLNGGEPQELKRWERQEEINTG
jgi:cytoskeletal protein RodZ